MKTLSIISIVILQLSFCISSYAQDMDVNIQKGHLGAVKIAAFSPDGKFLVTGGRDKTAKLWEIASGREMRTFLGHEATVQALKFSIDGKFIATGSTDQTVKLWNIETGELIRTYKVKDRVTTIDFTSDGKYMVVGGEEFIGYIFETETGNVIRNFKTSPDKGLGTGVKVDISKDNKSILVSEDNRKAIIVNFDNGEQIKELKSVEKGSCGGCGTYAKYLPDENFVVMGSHNGPLVLWDISKSEIIKTYIEKQEDVSSVDVSFDGKYILISDENSVVIYSKDTGKKINSVKAHDKNINFAGFSPDGNSYITASDDGTAVLRRTANGKAIVSFEGFVNQSDQGTKLDQESYWEYYARTYFDRKTSVKLSPDGKLLIIGKKDSIAKVLDFETGRTLYNLKGHAASVICFDFSPDSKMIATGSSDNTVKLWDAQNGQLVKSFKGHDNMVFSVKFNQDGTKIVSSGWDGYAFLWDINSEKYIQYYKDVKPFTSDFSTIGNYIVTGGLDKAFSLWEIDSKELFRQFVGHTDVVSSFDFTSDGKTMVSGSWDGTICIWDFISGFQLKKINTGQSQIHSVIFSDNGKYIFSGGSDGNIKMWETSTGKLMKTFTGHNSAVTSLQITPDNQSLISCSIEGTVIVWEIVNAKIIYTFYQLTRDDWFVKSRGGFFDGNAGAKKYIFFVKEMQTFGVDQFFEDFYRPGLLQQAYQTKGLINENMNMEDYLKKSPPPSLHFKTILNDSVIKTDIALIEFEIVDNGGGIDEIKVMHNGKRILHDYKNTAKAKRGKKTNEMIELLLVPGENNIQISAFSEGRIESSVIEQTWTFESNEYLPDCHILIIGIDKYKNETLNLNYAKADAKSFSDLIKKRSKPLFNNMKFYNLYDEDAKKINIINAVDEIAKNSKPEDVFIFYYAGHGSMIDDKFYFIPTDCIRLYDTDITENNAIAANDMQENFKKIKALKQIMILDACQSGGATEILGQRGAGREKAIAQLSRSTGIHVLASAGSEQFAVEFKSLGHGLFTYVLIDALNGSADGSPLDGKITIYELKSYLDDQVPEYTKKFKGIRQYPQSFSGGNDFPLAILSDID
jgi:WD40 repeat protein